MILKAYKPVLEIVLASLVSFAIHELFFYFFHTAVKSHFYYNLPFLYAFFCTFSVVIVLVLMRIKKKNIDSVGQAFLLLTCVKMVAAYLLLYPILQIQIRETKIEKINFFIVFAVFLAIETVVTIRILNNKQ